MKELWIVAGKSNPKFAIPVHTKFDEVDTEVVDILPAMHAPTGCDTTSKVGTKASELQPGIEEGQKLFFDFGRGKLIENMIAIVEYF